MRIQPMSSGLRIRTTLREARYIRALIEAGAGALGCLAPDVTPDFLAALDIGINDVASKQADARLRKKAREARADHPPMRNPVIDGYTICARLGDWIDVSADPDSRCWITWTAERDGQHEVRRGVWLVEVLNPDPYGFIHLGESACTETGDEAEIEPLARQLVSQLPARTIKPHVSFTNEADDGYSLA